PRITRRQLRIRLTILHFSAFKHIRLHNRYKRVTNIPSENKKVKTGFACDNAKIYGDKNTIAKANT
ncbi:MAG: hypothetical protein QXY07_04090, partial [Candidatus Bathyarchaeia archaeon]